MNNEVLPWAQEEPVENLKLFDGLHQLLPLLYNSKVNGSIFPYVYVRRHSPQVAVVTQLDREMEQGLYQRAIEVFDEVGNSIRLHQIKKNLGIENFEQVKAINNGVQVALLYQIKNMPDFIISNIKYFIILNYFENNPRKSALQTLKFLLRSYIGEVELL